ncbi:MULTISPECIES: TlpA disulfide reductase family protein [unclassified Roseovarius]|uniref:TlpA family protein disulfide reductase n=1 Tax=unclassified Roseovarius TaxID=2614913 RepID=UPI00273DD476|nr:MULTISPECIES: TlpA disulfide reductase family protein [unclassified Roseovarius]
MKFFASLVLYMALALGANGALADMSDIAALRTGDMKKLNLHAAPKEVSQATFIHEDGSDATLADLKGKVILLNFWAVWCGPCKIEMPMLSELQADLGGDGFAVVTLATSRNPPPAMTKFFEERGIDNLPLHRDPKSAVAREMGVFGLPVTVILNPEGQEIGRLTGEADWSSDSAKAVLQALIDQSPKS